MAKWRPEKRKSPCAECPFRKNSHRGYLGADNPEHFLEMTMRDADMPCHMDIDYSKKDWLEKQEPDAPLCVGAMQYQNNNMKLSRDPAIAEAQRAVGNNANVFSSPEEFLIHHKAGRWEGPVESSLWWSAHKVNLANGFTDIASAEHWQVEGQDEDGLWIGFDLNGQPIKVVEHSGAALVEVDWLKDYYHGRGHIKWLTVGQEQYDLALTVARQSTV